MQNNNKFYVHRTAIRDLEFKIGKNNFFSNTVTNLIFSLQ